MLQTTDEASTLVLRVFKQLSLHRLGLGDAWISTNCARLRATPWRFEPMFRIDPKTRPARSFTSPRAI
jgi:hypothetical protein